MEGFGILFSLERTNFTEYKYLINTTKKGDSYLVAPDCFQFKYFNKMECTCMSVREI